MTQIPESKDLLTRIADAVERLAPPPAPSPDWLAPAYVWDGPMGRLTPAPMASAVSLDLLCGIDLQKATLIANTRRFAQALPANNALLWGARGMGKSALVKAVHRSLAKDEGLPLVLVEIHAQELAHLDGLLRLIQRSPRQVLVFCDDLAFSSSGADTRALKALLEGGLAGRPSNALFYATSNRRHLMPRDMSENERSSPIHPDEEVEERVSLSDRFGIWLGFHACTQDVYLDIVAGYAAAFALPVTADELRSRAITWSAGRSARSGRTAWQFIQDLAGELGVQIRT